MNDENNQELPKTEIYSDNTDINKTQIQKDLLSKTEKNTHLRQSNEIVPRSPGSESTVKTITHGIGIGDNITLNGKEYQVIEIVSGEDQTGEAVIYKIRDHENQVFALKLYYKFQSGKEEPNPEALQRIKNIEDPDILKLYDFGTGPDKYRSQFCFEICAFAEGGDLLSIGNHKEKYTPEFIEKAIVPQIFLGIRCLHKNRIYHCDIKPQNIFYIDSSKTDLVIGDYGSSKTFEMTTTKDIDYTSTFKYTKEYLAPEQMRGVISEKNDYYSMGMVILHLLYPEYMNRQDLQKITVRQYAGKPIIDYDQKYDRLNQLIAGLTLPDIEKRWGQKELEQWMKGENVEVRYSLKAEPHPIKLGDATIKKESELISYIENNENWFDSLIVDAEGYQMMLNWLSDLQDLPRKRIFDQMIRYYQQDGKSYVKEAILRYFDCKRPVILDMISYKIFGDDKPSVVVGQFMQHMDDMWKSTFLDDLKFHIFKLEFALRQLRDKSAPHIEIDAAATLDKIASVLNISLTSEFYDYKAIFHQHLNDEKCLKLFYAFNPQRLFRDLSGTTYDSPEKMALFFARRKQNYDNRYLVLERTCFLQKTGLGSLEEKDFDQLLFNIFKDEIEPDIRFEGLYIGPNLQLTIKYKYRKSLSNFLQTHGIHLQLLYESTDIESYRTRKSAFIGLKGIFGRFLKYISQTHIIDKKYIPAQNKRKFYRELRSSLLKFYFSKRVFSYAIWSLVLSTIVAAILNSQFNSALNPFLTRNFYSPYLIFGLINIGFLFLAIMIAIAKQKAYELSVILGVFALLCFTIWIFWFTNRLHIADNIFEFRHKYYLYSNDYLLYSNKYTTVKPGDIIPYSERQKLNKISGSMVDNANRLKIQANCDVINLFRKENKRSFMEKILGSRGYLYSFTYSIIHKGGQVFNLNNEDYLYAYWYGFKDLGDFKSGDRYGPETVKYYPTHISFEIKLDDKRIGKRFGLFLKEWVILFSGKYVELCKVSEIPVESDKAENKFTYIVAGSRSNFDATSGSAENAWLQQWMDNSHISSAWYRNTIYSAPIKNWTQGYNTVDIIFLKNRFMVNVNSEVACTGDLDKKFWKSKTNIKELIGIVFEPEAEFEISKIQIYGLNEIESVINDSHKKTPLFASVIRTTKMLASPTAHSPDLRQMNLGDTVEILYYDSNYAKITYNNVDGYCKISDLGDIHIHPKIIGRGLLKIPFSGSLANIRSGPSANHQIAGKAYPGDTLLIMFCSGDWCKVRYGDKTGYIFHDLLNIGNWSSKKANTKPGGNRQTNTSSIISFPQDKLGNKKTDNKTDEGMGEATILPFAEKYSASISNVDDSATIYINGTPAIHTRWGLGDSKKIGHKPGYTGIKDISGFLKKGKNIFKLEIWNARGCCGVSGTFKIYHADSLIVERKYNKKDSNQGVKYSETVELQLK